MIVNIGDSYIYEDEIMKLNKIKFSKNLISVEDKLTFVYFPDEARLNGERVPPKSFAKISPNTPFSILTYDNVDLYKIVAKEISDEVEALKKLEREQQIEGYDRWIDSNVLKELIKDPNWIDPKEVEMERKYPASEWYNKKLKGIVIAKSEGRFRNPGWGFMDHRASGTFAISQGDFFEYRKGEEPHFHEKTLEYTLCLRGSGTLGLGSADKNEDKYLLKKSRIEKTDFRPMDLLVSRTGKDKSHWLIDIDIPYEHLCWQVPCAGKDRTVVELRD